MARRQRCPIRTAVVWLHPLEDKRHKMTRMISIIVPVYNEEKYLPQCLDSLVNQTYRDIEIICVNDGSTDGSLEILKRYAEKDERIKVVCQENQGVSESRNEGMQMAQGEWLMFVDSDDWLEQDCCERLMNVMNDYDLLIFSYIREFKSSSAPKHVFDDQPRLFEVADIDWLYERLIAPKGKDLKEPAKLDCLSTVWGKLYRTSTVKEYDIQFPSAKVTGTLEDMVFNGRYMNHVKRAYYIPDCLYHQQKTSSASMTYTYKPYLDKKWMHVFHEIEICSVAQDRPWITAALERRKALCLFGLGLNIVFSGKGCREEHRMLDDIVCSDWYKQAASHLDTRPMPPHWRCFYGAARRRCTWAVLLMVKVINVIINR